MQWTWRPSSLCLCRRTRIHTPTIRHSACAISHLAAIKKGVRASQDDFDVRPRFRDRARRADRRLQRNSRDRPAETWPSLGKVKHTSNRDASNRLTHSGDFSDRYSSTSPRHRDSSKRPFAFSRSPHASASNSSAAAKSERLQGRDVVSPRPRTSFSDVQPSRFKKREVATPRATAFAREGGQEGVHKKEIAIPTTLDRSRWKSVVAPRSKTQAAEVLVDTLIGGGAESIGARSQDNFRLLHHIKSACRAVQSIQQREANGHDTSDLIAAANSNLSNVNTFLTLGTFREDSARALSSLFIRKAPDGVFSQGEPRGNGSCLIFQRSDGTFELGLGDGKQRDTPDGGKRSAHSDAPKGKVISRTYRDESDEYPEGRDEIPVSIPYTTAASQFLYGYNAVLAALKAGRRKFYHLYIHPKIFDRESGSVRSTGHSGILKSPEKPAHEFVSLAKAAKLPFHNEFNTRLLDKMSEGRPHNGVVLEASRLPAPPVLSLGKPDMRKAVIPLALGPQSAEDAAVNSTPQMLQSVSNSWRYPLVVLLDGITDPGNMGNILRTCHFYGVDAVAVATTTCASISLGILAKASSGACEAINILAVSQPSNFIFESAKFKWKVYAAVAPNRGIADTARHDSTAKVAEDSPLAKHPCILMLGSEGQGLRENLKRRADRFVSIARGPKPVGTPDVDVDSVNVSVATGVLLESFLKKPASAPEKIDISAELGF